MIVRCLLTASKVKDVETDVFIFLSAQSTFNRNDHRAKTDGPSVRVTTDILSSLAINGQALKKIILNISETGHHWEIWVP